MARFRDDTPWNDPSAPLVTKREDRTPRKPRHDFTYRGGCEFTDALQQAYDRLIAAGFCATCKPAPRSVFDERSEE